MTAVLKRTAVVAPLSDRWADRQVVQQADLLVDPAVITWRPKVAATGFPMKRRRYTADQREAMRAASDLRARADQVRQAAAQAAARNAAAQQHAAPRTRQGAGATTSRPLAAAASQRATAASAVRAASRPVASKAQQSAGALASELRQARQRIAALEAELERHRAAEREMLRRIELIVGRRAA